MEWVNIDLKVKVMWFSREYSSGVGKYRLKVKVMWFSREYSSRVGKYR